MVTASEGIVEWVGFRDGTPRSAYRATDPKGKSRVLGGAIGLSRELTIAYLKKHPMSKYITPSRFHSSIRELLSCPIGHNHSSSYPPWLSLFTSLVLRILLRCGHWYASLTVDHIFFSFVLTTFPLWSSLRRRIESWLRRTFINVPSLLKIPVEPSMFFFWCRTSGHILH